MLLDGFFEFGFFLLADGVGCRVCGCGTAVARCCGHCGGLTASGWGTLGESVLVV